MEDLFSPLQASGRSQLSKLGAWSKRNDGDESYGGEDSLFTKPRLSPKSSQQTSECQGSEDGSQDPVDEAQNEK